MTHHKLKMLPTYFVTIPFNIQSITPYYVRFTFLSPFLFWYASRSLYLTQEFCQTFPTIFLIYSLITSPNQSFSSIFTFFASITSFSHLWIYFVSLYILSWLFHLTCPPYTPFLSSSSDLISICFFSCTNLKIPNTSLTPLCYNPTLALPINYYYVILHTYASAV